MTGAQKLGANQRDGEMNKIDYKILIINYL